MDKFTIIIVHGTGGYDVDWFFNLTRELNKMNIKHILLKLPNKSPIKKDLWLREIDKAVKEVKSPIVFIGYSLGTRAILLYLEKHKIKLKYILLVAAFSYKPVKSTRNNPKYSSFFKHEVNTKLITNQIKNITILHSLDDNIIPYSQAVELASKLNAELITYKNKRHFQKPAYYQDILPVLKTRIGI